MSNTPSYDELLKQFRDLQLRVTRFSATEQELINTRDRLDHELVLHQRLHRYNSEALKEPSEDGFFQLESEAIVDVFETEGSIIFYVPTHGGEVQIYKEGIPFAVDLNWLEEVRELSSKLAKGKSHIVKSDVLNLCDHLAQSLRS
jgi:hypothetical protein